MAILIWVEQNGVSSELLFELFLWQRLAKSDLYLQVGMKVLLGDNEGLVEEQHLAKVHCGVLLTVLSGIFAGNASDLLKYDLEAFQLAFLLPEVTRISTLCLAVRQSAS